MGGTQEYAGPQNRADASAKRAIQAVARAGMKGNPSFASQPGYCEGPADERADRGER